MDVTQSDVTSSTCGMLASAGTLHHVACNNATLGEDLGDFLVPLPSSGSSSVYVDYLTELPFSHQDQGSVT